MKVIYSVFLFAMISSSAFAIDFHTKATYCNGPVTDGDVSQCNAFSDWMGVSLKNLNSVDLPVAAGDTAVRLQDEAGHSWEQPLEPCQSENSDEIGCKITIDTKNPKRIAININMWGFGESRNISLFVNDGNQLTILPTSGDQFMFDLTKASDSQ